MVKFFRWHFPRRESQIRKVAIQPANNPIVKGWAGECNGMTEGARLTRPCGEGQRFAENGRPADFAFVSEGEVGPAAWPRFAHADSDRRTLRILDRLGRTVACRLAQLFAERQERKIGLATGWT